MRRHRAVPVLSTLALVAGLVIAMALPATAATAIISVTEFQFAPSDVTIKSGDTVLWRVDGIAPHTVTAVDGSFDSGTVFPGDVFARPITGSGTVAFFCEIHPWMRGSVTVSPRSADRVAAASGNVATAIQWSKRLPANSQDVALLARDDVFADALASGPAQGALGAPLLLTGRDALSPATRNELTRLDVEKVFILGGTGAISGAVESQLQSMGIVTERIAGSNRFTTATAIASRLLPGADTAIVARAFGSGSDPSQAFADSLSAGGVGAHLGAPILLTDTGSLTGATADYIRTRGISTVVIAGGPGAVSQAVEDALTALGVEVQRVAGADRTMTSLLMHELVWPAATTPLSADKPAQLILVNGGGADSWASGFPAALHAVRGNAHIVNLTGASTLAEQVAFLLRPRIVCGPGIASAMCDRMAAISNAPDTLDAAAQRRFPLNAEEQPQGGDPDQLPGDGILYPTSDPGMVCAEMNVFIDEPLTAAHVHAASTGAPVITLPTEASPLSGTVFGCTDGVDPAVVRAVFANPADYYVNVHTASHPQGAQAGVPYTPRFLLVADLTSDQEVPPSGTPGGGIYFLTGRSTTEICWQAFMGGLTGPATAAHIHDGDRGQNGPVLVPLTPPVSLGDFTVSFGCADATAEQVSAIANDPFAHYVNVHTAANPGGELRGQIFAIPPL